MSDIKIRSALISVFHKDGLDEIIKLLDAHHVTIYSTGGTYSYIESLGVKVEAVEDLTGYPEILDGRVKTLHPAVFGGILARREAKHLDQLSLYNIPAIDLVIVDLYPFESTVQSQASHEEIIEKIDIGGISLIRAAAKNFRDVVIIPSKNQYSILIDILKNNNGFTNLQERKALAAEAFAVSSGYDTAIFSYFDEGHATRLRLATDQHVTLRYGENPHQKAAFYGHLDQIFEQISGKELSYNNLLDIDAAVELMHELDLGEPAFAIIKHTNACGVAIRDSVHDAWRAALQGDPVSAFGGILISNTKIDVETATEINNLFYEVLIAPDFDEAALSLLLTKKRIILKLLKYPPQEKNIRTALGGVLIQDADKAMDERPLFETKTRLSPDEAQIRDMQFALTCVKHIKSNAIVFVKNRQLLGMGSGKTSRVDACKQAILKAKAFGLNLSGSVMASDAFFPFPDCVELAHNEGVTAVVQPGGSVKDQLSIDYCDNHRMTMVFTGRRHFKH
jgi:phosphoribosylaminoimidazolecarboxamide formyltransferase/IMP cyclohydrolase